LISYNTNTQDGATPLWIASHNGYQKLVEILLRAKANPDMRKK